MDAATLVCAHKIVARALRRIPSGRIGLHDRDDLRQELLLAVFLAYKRHDGRADQNYLYKAVDNAVCGLWDFSFRGSRHPKDRYGMPVRHAFRSDVDCVSGDVDLEDRYDNAECVQRVLRRLPASQQQLVLRELRGESELSAAAVQHIQYVLGLREVMP